MGDALTALVPLRSVDDPGKTRLAGYLGATQRGELVAAMFFDVVDTLRSADVTDVVVLAGDRSAARIAEDCGCAVVPDPPGGPTGLAEVVAVGRRRVGPELDTLVVMPDLPALTPGEVRRLGSSTAPVAIAPTDDGGTGGLLLRGRVSVGLRFGPHSASHHAMACMQAGLTFEWSRSPGFALDVDTPEDLLRLPHDRLGPAARELLSASPTGNDLADVLERRTGRRPSWAGRARSSMTR